MSYVEDEPLYQERSAEPDPEPKPKVQRASFRIYSKYPEKIGEAKKELEDHVKRYHRKSSIIDKNIVFLAHDESFYDGILGLQNEMVRIYIGRCHYFYLIHPMLNICDTTHPLLQFIL